MGAIISGRLSDEQKNTLVTGFLKNLGQKLRSKRNRANLSQSELSACLDITQTTLSKYESGTRDMQVSMLPLFSTYCKFPLCELFPHDESRMILDTFSAAVSITVDRKKRQEDLRQKKAAEQAVLKQAGQEKILKGQIFEVDGKDVYEPVPPKTSILSLRNQYKDAEMHTEYGPYSETEFCDFVRAKDEALVESVLCAGQFLKQLEGTQQKDTLKGAVADYIIDELVINHVARKHPDEASRRAYEYYRKLYHQFLNKTTKN